MCVRVRVHAGGRAGVRAGGRACVFSSKVTFVPSKRNCIASTLVIYWDWGHKLYAYLGLVFVLCLESHDVWVCKEFFTV